jgi:CPA2 family monovalent cation:H+ antiporter-2
VTLAAAGASSSTVLVELGAVVLLLALAGRLADRLGISPVPLYLLAGLTVGEGGVVELVTARSFIETGAQIGVVLLLLMLGLEYSAEELVTSLRANRAASVIDLALNTVPGMLAALLMGWSATAAVFLGGITYISSSGIVSKLLSDLGRLGNRETPTIMSILIVEDLVMAVFLPVAAGLLVSTGVVDSLGEVAVAGLAVALAFVLTTRFGDHLSALVFTPSSEVVLLTLIGIALVVAGSAEEIHAPAAVGALLVGIALSGPAADAARIVLTPLRDLFAAVFFVFFGLEVDLTTLLPVLPVAAALAVVSAATKISTGAWAARRAGIGLPGRLRAGTALIARGEFSIIIAGLALSGGLDEPKLGPLAATYVLILATAGPLSTRFADQVAFALLRARHDRAR